MRGAGALVLKALTAHYRGRRSTESSRSCLQKGLNAAAQISHFHSGFARMVSRGRLAQLGERLVRNEEAGGSNPLPSTKHQRPHETHPLPIDGRFRAAVVAGSGRPASRQYRRTRALRGLDLPDVHRHRRRHRVGHLPSFALVQETTGRRTALYYHVWHMAL